MLQGGLLACPCQCTVTSCLVWTDQLCSSVVSRDSSTERIQEHEICHHTSVTCGVACVPHHTCDPWRPGHQHENGHHTCRHNVWVTCDLHHRCDPCVCLSVITAVTRNLYNLCASWLDAPNVVRRVLAVYGQLLRLQAAFACTP